MHNANLATLQLLGVLFAAIAQGECTAASAPVAARAAAYGTYTTERYEPAYETREDPKVAANKKGIDCYYLKATGNQLFSPYSLNFKNMS